MDPDAEKCPVCGARFRGTCDCSRCGANLTPLLRTLARAWLARRAARKALVEFDFDRSARWTGLAQNLHVTAEGRLLASICAAFRRIEHL